MAIVKMSKFNLLSFNYDRDNLLKKLQDFEFVHFNDLTKTEDEEIKSLGKIALSSDVNEVNDELTKVSWSINLLTKYKEKEGMIKSLKEGVPTYTFDEIKEKGNKFNFNDIYKRVLRSSDIIDGNRQDIHNKSLKIDELKLWTGINIPISELYGFQNVFLTTGIVSKKNFEEFEINFREMDDVVIETIGEDKDGYYIIFISNLENKKHYLEILRNNGYNSVIIGTNGIVSEEIKTLTNSIEECKTIIAEEENKLRDEIKHLEEIEVYYEYLANILLRETSAENFVTTEKINLIEGYVPTHLIGEFKKVVSNILDDRYYLNIEDALKDDPNVPIILENGKFTEAFEGMTQMYALPRYNELDPTPLFAPFYAIFAGMMVGDFGYGLLLTLGCLIGLKFFNLEKSKRKFIKFFMFIGISTMFWGFIYGSAFGFSMVKDPIMSPSEDYLTMITLSLALGGIHLFFGMGIKAYMLIRDKHYLDALFDVGFWYMALIGIIVYGLSTFIPLINKGAGKVGLYVSLIGMAGIWATGGRAEKSVGGKIGQGLYELYGITGYIGDFVSYLRLLALSLSGGFIAMAVNLIVELLFGSGIVGIIFGLIVFVAFQLFNMFLSYLSAYVHTARLTYVEMFNKFYEGGGIPFKKMIEKAKYFNIKEE